MSGWNSRNRLRPGSKHLCGQTCLHKLVDDFMARALAVRPQPGAEEQAEVEVPAVATDANLTSNAAYVEAESSARLLMPPTPELPKRPPSKVQAELVAMPGRVQAEEPSLAPDEPPCYASRNWRPPPFQFMTETKKMGGCGVDGPVVDSSCPVSIHSLERASPGGFRRHSSWGG